MMENAVASGLGVLIGQSIWLVGTIVVNKVKARVEKRNTPVVKNAIRLPKAGEIWAFRHDVLEPWNTKDRMFADVVSVKDGWVSYRIHLFGQQMDHSPLEKMLLTEFWGMYSPFLDCKI
jgi:hypothetical protein